MWHKLYSMLNRLELNMLWKMQNLPWSHTLQKMQNQQGLHNLLNLPK
jgi:hypothetical protein